MTPYKISLVPGNVDAGVAVEVKIEVEAGAIGTPLEEAEVSAGVPCVPGSWADVGALPMVAVTTGLTVLMGWVEVTVDRGEEVDGMDVAGMPSMVLVGKAVGNTTVGGGAVGTV